MAELNQELTEWTSRIRMEKQRVRRELIQEEKLFQIEWSRYETRLEKDVMKSKLASEWTPQLDVISGETYYLNIQTTKKSREHPNIMLYKTLIKKQKSRAQMIYDERKARLEHYMEQLEAENEINMARIHEVLSSHEC